MADNFLQLNSDETEAVSSSATSLVPQVIKNVPSLSSSVKSSLQNLGDNRSATVLRYSFHFFPAAEILQNSVCLTLVVPGFFLSHLDFCCSCFVFSLDYLQVAQNAAAILFIMSPKSSPDRDWLVFTDSPSNSEWIQDSSACIRDLLQLYCVSQCSSFVGCSWVQL